MHRAVPLGAIALVVIACCTAPAWCQPTRPNVVIVLADDLGIGDLGCYNPASKIPTPNADQLAAQGVRFTDAHSPSAVCSPTRYALLTGRYAWRTRLKSWVLDGDSQSLIEPGRSTIASMLRDAGYHTAVVGKWHLGLGEYDPEQPDRKATYDAPIRGGPLAAGFDEALIVPASLDMPPYVFVRDDRPIEPVTGHTDGSKRRWDGGGGFWRAGAMGESFDFTLCLPRLTDEAVRVVREGAERNQPFFLYFPLTGPHTPWMPTDDWQGTSDAGWYGDFVAECDDALGRVLAAIDDAGIADNTIVVFTSDNGSHWRPQDEEQFAHLANLNYRGMKADIHEAGHRVPMIVRWPGVTPEGEECGMLVGLLDWQATLAEGLNLPRTTPLGLDGVQFFDILDRPDGWKARESLVHHSGDGMFAIRRGKWKLIQGLGSGGFTRPARSEPTHDQPPGQLYDLDNDPSESVNLWLKHPVIVEELLAELTAVRGAEH